MIVLSEWTERLRREAGDSFPRKATAFRPEMLVDGRYREPCARCGDPVQRIIYASRETNYCATCQTGGQVYADRVLSQLLKKDWPRTVEEWEQVRQG
jgi:formamidopyrimidine-DNA glycosylase